MAQSRSTTKPYFQIPCISSHYVRWWHRSMIEIEYISNPEDINEIPPGPLNCEQFTEQNVGRNICNVFQNSFLSCWKYFLIMGRIGNGLRKFLNTSVVKSTKEKLCVWHRNHFNPEITISYNTTILTLLHHFTSHFLRRARPFSFDPNAESSGYFFPDLLEVISC